MELEHKTGEVKTEKMDPLLANFIKILVELKIKLIISKNTYYQFFRVIN